MSKEFGISILTQVGGWLAALVTSASIACILDMCGRPLSWYSRPWLITGIYVLPTFIVLAFASMALLRFKKVGIYLSFYKTNNFLKFCQKTFTLSFILFINLLCNKV